MSSSQIQSSQEAVAQCLLTLSNVIRLHIVEVWTHSREGFVLVQTHVNSDAMYDQHQLISRYHTGELDNVLSRNICKRSMQSKHGFYWLAKQNRSVSVDLPFHTAIGFHMPRDNINTDFFLLGYSKEYMRYSQSKLDFLCWMSQATCLAAFSPTVLSYVDDEESTVVAFENSMMSKETRTPDSMNSGATTNEYRDSLTLGDCSGGTSIQGLWNCPSEPSSSGVVEVFEHMESDRRIDVKSMHIRRRSMCIQQSFKHDFPTPPHPLSSTSTSTLPPIVPAHTQDSGHHPSTLLAPLDVQDAVRSAMENMSLSPKSPSTGIVGSARPFIAPVGPIGTSPSAAYASGPAFPPANSQPLDHSKQSAVPAGACHPSTSHGAFYNVPDPRIAIESPGLDDVDDSSTVYINAGQVSTFNIKSHPVDLVGLERSICEGSQHSRGDFSFKISKLDIRRHINRQVDLNDFTNMAYLTEGSNSHIFSAMWNNQPVIVKMLQADKVNNALALHEFDIEVELLSRIDHPNIVQVLGSGSNPRPYIVLERLRDLSEVLDLNSNEESRPSIFHRRKFSYVEVLQLAKDLADAINYIHSEVNPNAMIIHRDLKPENLGLSSDGRLKLFDFGLCRCVKKRTQGANTYEMTGNTGSLRYMAPEVVLDMPYNETVDAYSFGIVVWTIACNKLPFRGFDRAKHHSTVVIGGGRPKLESGWPPAFSQLLSECWHRDSAKRPAFSEIATRLGQILEAERATTTSKAPSVLRRVSVSMFGLNSKR